MAIQFWDGKILFISGGMDMMMAMDPACCCAVGPTVPTTDCGTWDVPASLTAEIAGVANGSTGCGCNCTSINGTREIPFGSCSYPQNEHCCYGFAGTLSCPSCGGSLPWIINIWFYDSGGVFYLTGLLLVYTAPLGDSLGFTSQAIPGLLDFDVDFTLVNTSMNTSMCTLDPSVCSVRVYPTTA